MHVAGGGNQTSFCRIENALVYVIGNLPRGIFDKHLGLYYSYIVL